MDRRQRLTAAQNPRAPVMTPAIPGTGVSSPARRAATVRFDESDRGVRDTLPESFEVEAGRCQLSRHGLDAQQSVNVGEAWTF